MCRLLVASAAVSSIGLVGIMPSVAAQTNAIEPLVDLAPDSVQPTDGATVQLDFLVVGDSTLFTFAMSGPALDAAQTGRVLGVQIHVGPCDGDRQSIGPVYNSTGQPPTTVSRSTEVWLDVVVGSDGTGSIQTVVPFVIPPEGANSVVIHETATGTDGSAGAPWACAPIRWVSDAEYQTRIDAAVGDVQLVDEVLGLAITGSDQTRTLALVGGVLVLTGGLALHASSRLRRDLEHE
jgi:hypothetical protein